MQGILGVRGRVIRAVLPASLPRGQGLSVRRGSVCPFSVMRRSKVRTVVSFCMRAVFGNGILSKATVAMTVGESTEGREIPSVNIRPSLKDTPGGKIRRAKEGVQAICTDADRKAVRPKDTKSVKKTTKEVKTSKEIKEDVKKAKG